MYMIHVSEQLKQDLRNTHLFIIWGNVVNVEQQEAHDFSSNEYTHE